MGSVNTRAVTAEALRPGDHIFIWDRSHWPFSYQHHGIVWSSGNSVEEVQVCHVWTPVEGFRQAQLDSSFRVSTLEKFLYHRDVADLQLVEYKASDLKFFKRSSSDSPEVVLARCKFLLGHGRGDYNAITQNCEHAARWCKTGQQWCSQTLTVGHGSVPFEQHLRREDIAALEHHIARLQKLPPTTNGIGVKARDFRANTRDRTLFWLDSFSSEAVDTRMRLARIVFKWSPMLKLNAHLLRSKNSIWRTSSAEITWGGSSLGIITKPRIHVDCFSHVPFTASLFANHTLFSISSSRTETVA